MIGSALAALLALSPASAPATIPNPSFERGLEDWTVEAGPGFEVTHRRSDARRRATRGTHWLSIARPGAPPRDDAEARLTVALDAHPHRGRRLRLTASTWIPEYADRRVRMFARMAGPSGDTLAEARLMSSDYWTRQSLVFAVPHEARRIEIGFIVPGRDGALDLDALQLEPVRR